ncbi:MAG: hypothetical protein IMY71_14595 [Bacteroidetes bacterium]|nr:hypothetical protein [Bacteroidota bacterium]
MKQEKHVSGHVEQYRTVHLSKIIDPAIEKRVKAVMLLRDKFLRFVQAGEKSLLLESCDGTVSIRKWFNNITEYLKKG